SSEDGSHVVFAPHWYDAFVLVKKHFSPWVAVDSSSQKPVLGRRAARRSVREQLSRLTSAAMHQAGGAPTLLAEFGTPFDLDRGKAFRTRDFRAQEKALDRSFTAIEENLLSCTIWNYCADNTNERGDQWNGEDLSIFSADQLTDPGDINSGGRGLRAFVRPFARATAGEVTRMRFDMRSRTFELAFRHDPRASAPTEIFVPRFQYPNGFRVEASDGTFAHLPESQVLEYRHTTDHDEHWIRLRPKEKK
ncbi:MAG TPA: hypothetical protein VL354_13685, partial [Spirochaetia bacterium]|nr:hypothetical protein [Spirochaetia bacterium]